MTPPDERETRIPTRPLCARCHRYIVIDSVAADDLWREVIGETHGPGYICADCFARAADERLIDWTDGLSFRPISLAGQVAVQAAALRLLPDTKGEGRG
ncbi:MAG: hypothetical protein EOP67_29415 [Sphingomonas sp.]|nr:MAG: hypothetical protein EOP67_29415 [Sphingomonas sp.]